MVQMDFLASNHVRIVGFCIALLPMVKSLEVCFVKPSVINSSRDILKVNLKNNENLTPTPKLTLALVQKSHSRICWLQRKSVTNKILCSVWNA